MSWPMIDDEDDDDNNTPAGSKYDVLDSAYAPHGHYVSFLDGVLGK